MYNASNQIKFKTSIIRSRLCDYSDAYFHVKGTIIVPDTWTQDAPAYNKNKKVIFKSSAPFTNCIRELDNTLVDDAHNIDFVMPMSNLLDYSNIYSETSGTLWQYHRDEPALDNNDAITDFPAYNNDSKTQKLSKHWFHSKNLSNFWRILEMPLITCGISLILSWSKECVLATGTAIDQVPKITDTKPCVSIVPLLTQDNVKLLN